MQAGLNTYILCKIFPVEGFVLVFVSNFFLDCFGRFDLRKGLRILEVLKYALNAHFAKC